MRRTVYWIAIALALPAIWHRPFWGVLLYSSFNIIRPEMLFWGGTTAAKTFQILAAATIISAVFNHLNKSTQLQLFKHPNLYLILWLFFALLISTLLSEYEIYRSYYYLFEILKIFVLCALATIFIITKKEIIVFQKVLVGCIFFLSTWGIDQYFRGNVRLEGLGGFSYMDSNGFAAMLVLFFPVSVALFFSSAIKIEKMFWIASSCSIVGAIICTSSRGGTVGLTAAIIILILGSKKKIQLIIAGIIVSLAILPLLSSDYIDRMSTMKDVETIDYSGQSRFAYWKAAWEIFKDNPIIGTGFLSFKKAKMKYKYSLNLDADLRDYAFKPNKVGHGTYFQVLSEGGLLAAIPYLCLILFTIKENWKIGRKLRGNPEVENLLILLAGINAGIIGFSICIIAIDAIIDVMFPLQMTICAIIRYCIGRQSGQVTVSPAKT